MNRRVTAAVTDHHGKTSQGRVAAVAGLAVAGTLALAPLWGGPAPEFDVLVLFTIGPGGLALWQKLGASQEQPPATG